MNNKKLIIYTDGGARSNPGHAGIGIVIYDENMKELEKFGEYIGKATNNQAEYYAVIKALEMAKEYKVDELVFYIDSELIVKQINREYRVKDQELAKLFLKIYNHTIGYKKIQFFHIPREKNTQADREVNIAIDAFLNK